MSVENLSLVGTAYKGRNRSVLDGWALEDLRENRAATVAVSKLDPKCGGWGADSTNIYPVAPVTRSLAVESDISDRRGLDRMDREVIGFVQVIRLIAKFHCLHSAGLGCLLYIPLPGGQALRSWQT
jgi:hypothetical protein